MDLWSPFFLIPLAVALCYMFPQFKAASLVVPFVCHGKRAINRGRIVPLILYEIIALSYFLPLDELEMQVPKKEDQEEWARTVVWFLLYISLQVAFNTLQLIVYGSLRFCFPAVSLLAQIPRLPTKGKEAIRIVKYRTQEVVADVNLYRLLMYWVALESLPYLESGWQGEEASRRAPDFEDTAIEGAAEASIQPSDDELHTDQNLHQNSASLDMPVLDIHATPKFHPEPEHPVPSGADSPTTRPLFAHALQVSRSLWLSLWIPLQLVVYAVSSTVRASLCFAVENLQSIGLRLRLALRASIQWVVKPGNEGLTPIGLLVIFPVFAMSHPLFRQGVPFLYHGHAVFATKCRTLAFFTVQTISIWVDGITAKPSNVSGLGSHAGARQHLVMWLEAAAWLWLYYLLELGYAVVMENLFNFRRPLQRWSSRRQVAGIESTPDLEQSDAQAQINELGPVKPFHPQDEHQTRTTPLHDVQSNPKGRHYVLRVMADRAVEVSPVSSLQTGNQNSQEEGASTSDSVSKPSPHNRSRFPDVLNVLAKDLLTNEASTSESLAHGSIGPSALGNEHVEHVVLLLFLHWLSVTSPGDWPAGLSSFFVGFITQMNSAEAAPSWKIMAIVHTVAAILTQSRGETSAKEQQTMRLFKSSIARTFHIIIKLVWSRELTRMHGDNVAFPTVDVRLQFVTIIEALCPLISADKILYMQYLGKKLAAALFITWMDALHDDKTILEISSRCLLAGPSMQLQGVIRWEIFCVDVWEKCPVAALHAALGMFWKTRNRSPKVCEVVWKMMGVSPALRDELTHSPIGDEGVFPILMQWTWDAVEDHSRHGIELSQALDQGFLFISSLMTYQLYHSAVGYSRAWSCVLEDHNLLLLVSLRLTCQDRYAYDFTAMEYLCDGIKPFVELKPPMNPTRMKELFLDTLKTIREGTGPSKVKAEKIWTHLGATFGVRACDLDAKASLESTS